MSHTLYLASKSPRRKEILDLLNLEYTVRVTEADESLPSDITMADAGKILAMRKASALRDILAEEGIYNSNTSIIAADTLVYIENQRLGKPQNEQEAFDMLCSLRGKTHMVCTGVCLAHGDKIFEMADITKVTMRNFSDSEAMAYIKTGEPMDKAGAYGIQGIGSVLIEKIEGDFFTVMGLSPLCIYKLLDKANISYFDLLKEKL